MIIFKSQAILITYSNVYIGGGVCLFPLYNFFLFSFSFMGGVAFHPKSVNLLTYSPHATWDVCFMNFMTTHNNFVFRNYSILHFQLKLFILDSFTIFLQTQNYNLRKFTVKSFTHFYYELIIKYHYKQSKFKKKKKLLFQLVPNKTYSNKHIRAKLPSNGSGWRSESLFIRAVD